MSRLYARAKRYVAARKATTAVVSPSSLLFPAQLAVVQDGAKFRALLCGRRAGKTATMLYDFAQGMLDEPGSLCLYVALTIGSAREILWEPFKRANERYAWGFVFDEAKMIVKHGNGSRLIIRGADDVRELEKLRGLGFRKIRIDECGAHRPSYLRYLVEEILEATLMDSDGDVWLAGTCTAQAFGYFYDLTTGRLPGYSVHRWTAADNPHVDFARFVHDPTTGLLKRRNWDESNAIFRREYLAEWVTDSVRRVYRYDRDRNAIDALFPLRAGDTYRRVLALDFGVGDATAACVLTHPRKWGRWVAAEHTWQESGLAPSEACERIHATVQRYRPDVIVGDVGGLGKAYQAEWNRRFPHIAMRAADKQHKRAALEFASDALHTADRMTPRGLFLLDGAGNDQLDKEWATLLWAEDRSDIADGQDDHVSHAALYGYRECMAFVNEAQPEAPPAPTEGTTWEGRRTVDPKARDLSRGWWGG